MNYIDKEGLKINMHWSADLQRFHFFRRCLLLRSVTWIIESW